MLPAPDIGGVATAHNELEWALKALERRRAELEADSTAQVAALQKRIAAQRRLSARVKSAQDRADGLHAKLSSIDEQLAEPEKQADGLKEERAAVAPAPHTAEEELQRCHAEGLRQPAAPPEQAVAGLA